MDLKKPAQNHPEDTSMKAFYATSDSQFWHELPMIFEKIELFSKILVACRFVLVHFWSILAWKVSNFWAVGNFDQFHEDNRKNPHDHIMTFWLNSSSENRFTRTLENLRQKYFFFQRGKSMQHPVFVYITRRLQWIAIDCKRNQL